MEKKQTIHECFAQAQSEFPLIKKTENNPFFKSKYAGLPNVLEVVLPVLLKNDLFLTQNPITEGDRIGVETKIVHVSTGESMVSKFTVNLAKNDPQGAGSALTYCRRYALVSMLGLNVDEDDDGNKASEPVVQYAAKPAPKPVDPFKAAQKAITETSTPEEMSKLAEKINASVKFTAEQKAELMDSLSARAELV